MLRSRQDLEECTDGMKDGDIGQVQDIYINDHAWARRHLVVNKSNCGDADFAIWARAAAGGPQAGS